MSMRSLAMVAGALLLISGDCAAKKVKLPPQGVKAPGLPAAYARPAVDHVVTYAFWRGFGPKDGDRITLWHHGSLTRQLQEFPGSKRDSDPASETIYSNQTTGASIAWYERGPGQPMGFTFWRDDETEAAHYRYKLVRTGETRTIAGERCEMWREEPLGKAGGVFTGVPRRACITADGVVLYEGWGNTSEERTAIKIERREVGLAEVLPPKDALNWPAWMARTKDLVPKPTNRPENYDLTLTRKIPKIIDWDGGADRVRQRASGGWMLVEDWKDGKRVTYWLRHSSGGLTLQVSKSLSISFYPNPRTPNWSDAVPLKGKPKEVLGEECSGYNAAPNVYDYWRTECRTADGLPLIIDEDSWGNAAPTLTAVSLSRGKTPLRDLMPPPRLLSWTRWGWPELDRR